MPIKNTFADDDNISYPFSETDMEMSAGEIDMTTTRELGERSSRRMTTMEKIRRLRTLFAKHRAVFIISLLIVFGTGYGMYEKYFHLTAAEQAKKELAAAVAAVSKHMILPEGDEPVLATVTDAKALIAQQAFFAGSENGDQLLLYPKNMKAVIWSSARKVIVNVGPIQQSPQEIVKSEILNPKSETPNQSSQSSDATGQANSNVQNMLTVEVRNGTNKTGYAATVAGQIQANKGYAVIKVGDADNKNYKKTVVVSRAGDGAKSRLAGALASALGTSVVSELPNGEKSTEADALVILGE